MSIVYGIAAALLLAAGTLVVWRLLRGPATLDRLVAMDMFVAITMGGLGVWVAASKDTTVVPGILTLALLGFVGSIAVARFRVRDDEV